MTLIIPKAPEGAPADGIAKVVLPEDATAAALNAANAPKTEERPAWLPEGIDTPEALAEAYKALKNPPADPVKAPATLAITTPEQAAQAAKDKGVDLAALSEEFATNGELTPASLKMLADKGIPQAAVDAYIEGQKAQAQVHINTVAAHVGGVENLQALLSWSTTGIAPDDIAVYNKLLGSGDVSMAKLAVDAIKAKYEAELGTSPSFLTGKGVPASAGVKPYASQAEVTKAMRSNEYKTDPAFRAIVAKRLEVSSF